MIEIEDPNQPFWDKLEVVIVHTRKETKREQELYDTLTTLPIDIIKYGILPFDSEWDKYEIDFEIQREPHWYYQPYDYQPYEMCSVKSVPQSVMDAYPQRFVPDYRSGASEKKIFDSKMIYLSLLGEWDWYLTNGDIDRYDWIARQDRIHEGWDLFYHRISDGIYDCREYARWMNWRLIIDEECVKTIPIKLSYRYAIPFIWFKIPTDREYSVQLQLVHDEDVLYTSRIYKV